MTFQDIFKSSFLENVNSVSLLDMGIALALAFCLGLFIFLVYKKTFNGVMYSSSFGVTLIALTMITTVVILAVTSNVVLSLGMVGALSIVRFRTAVKDPMDLAFLFWTISVGIICGAGLHEVALEASFLITIVMLGLHFIPNSKPAQLLLVNGRNSSLQKELEKIVRENTISCKVKSRNVSQNSIDMIFEVKVKDEAALINSVLTLEGIVKANLLTHDGEVTY